MSSARLTNTAGRGVDRVPPAFQDPSRVRSLPARTFPAAGDTARCPGVSGVDGVQRALPTGYRDNLEFRLPSEPSLPHRKLRQHILGACPKIDCTTAGKTGWPGFPVIFAESSDYSPQMFDRSDSISPTLATNVILGQAPRFSAS